MSHRLEGRRALVTGSSRGIGAAIAERLAGEGAAVAVHYSKSPGKAEEVASRIKAKGGNAVVVGGDLSRWGEARKVVEESARLLGGLDILVNNAGVYELAPAAEVTESQYRKVFDLNVAGVLAATGAAANLLPKGRGRVINVSSIVATGAMPASSVYSATKAAVDAITRIHAVDLGPKGITVNGIAPGLTTTDMTSGFDGPARAGVAAQTPLGRIGEPEDMAGLAAFLASDDAAWITGEVIAASGGLRS